VQKVADEVDFLEMHVLGRWSELPMKFTLAGVVAST
jgi:hypothetical protein